MRQGILFDGPDLTVKDELRLAGLLLRVRDYMSDGQWHTLDEIATQCKGSEAGVSARLRDLRKKRFGSHAVDRRRRAGHEGLWEYRLLGRSKT